jgi:hypothetical protein
MKLLEALALVDTTEGAVGITLSGMSEEAFYYKLDGVLYLGYDGTIDPDSDNTAEITLALLERNDFELVMKAKPVITFTEEQFIAAWDNAVRRAVPTLGVFNNSNIAKATLNTLKQLYTVR